MADTPQLPREAVSTWILTAGRDHPGRAAKHRLVDETRRLIEAVTAIDTSDRDGTQIDAATEEVKAVTERLAALPHFAAGSAEGGADDARLLERSGMSGASNPLSPPVRIWLDGDRVRGQAVYGYPYEGPPGCVHGGFVAAAFDDLLGSAQTLSGTAGFTGTLTIRMVGPTPLNRPIDYEAGVRSVEGRKIVTWGLASHNGEIIAQAEGLFITPRAGMEDDRMARAAAPLLSDPDLNKG